MIRTLALAFAGIVCAQPSFAGTVSQAYFDTQSPNLKLSGHRLIDSRVVNCPSNCTLSLTMNVELCPTISGLGLTTLRLVVDGVSVRKTPVIIAEFGRCVQWILLHSLAVQSGDHTVAVYGDGKDKSNPNHLKTWSISYFVGEP
jgi:hypothetical protein